MRRSVAVFTALFLSILIAVPSLAAVEVPDTATPVSMQWTQRFIYRFRSETQWYSSSDSPTVEDFYSDNGHMNDQVAVIPCVIFSDSPSGNYYELSNATTYYIEYEVQTRRQSSEFLSYSTNPDFYRFVGKRHVTDLFGDWSSSLVSSPGLDDDNSIPLTFYASNTAVSVVPVDERTYKVTFCFSTGIGVETSNVVALCMPSTGFIAEQPDKFSIITFQAYADPVGDAFDQIQLQIAQQQQQSLDQINGKLDGIGSQLGDLNQSMQGDPNDYQDNTGFDSAAGELEDLESQINDQITSDVTVDGESYEMNGDLIGNYKESFMDRWDPQDYEATAGREIARLFDLFYPYVGVAIFLNLTLAVIMAFLRGRANA